jgi:biotin carboxylase
MRERLREAGLPVPGFVRLPPGGPLPEPRYPCVVKPPMLSGSQGVIRADDATALAAAVDRVRRILARYPSALAGEPGFAELLVEDYVAGPEIAVEGLVEGGVLDVLAIFDKPDPLEGPFFEETLYVTPSRHPDALQRRGLAVTQDAVAALGLSDGPIHAELRLGPDGPMILEIAARSIGGLCGQALVHVLGARAGGPRSLEDLLLSRALGRPISRPPSSTASGVMMFPVPRDGVLRAVQGLDEARATPHVDAVTVAVEIGQAVRRLPEGNRYLGFAFAHAPEPDQVEEALRDAHARLRFELAPLLPTY